MKQFKLLSVLVLLLFSAGANAQFAWYGSEGVAQVETNLAEGTGDNQGVWWVAIDNGDGGKSKVIWDDGTEYDGNSLNSSVPDDNYVLTYGGISGTAVLNRGTLNYHPFVNVGFLVAGWDSDKYPLPADVSAWEGIAISYSCDIDASLVLGLGDYDAQIGYANPEVSLPKAPEGNFVRIKWSKFVQPSWYKESQKIEGSEAAEKLVNIKFKIQSSNGSYKFKINAIGSYNMLPSTHCKLKITATGNGSALFGSNTINNNTSDFVVDKGTDPNISFVPDAGYKIKSVKVGGADVTASVVSNSYTVSNIQDNTTVAVEFEALPTYQLTVSVTGDGFAKYDETAISNSSKVFTVIEGTNATITFVPDAGQMVKSVKLGSLDVTSSVTDNSYTLNIQSNATVTVVFGAIPPCQLTISATGNGAASFNSTEVRNTTAIFYVDKGANPQITFSPDAEHMIKSVKVGTTDVTASIVSDSYTISNIQDNAIVTVEFEEIPKEKCITPTISYSDGKLSFDCDTEDVKFYYEITNVDVKTGAANHEVKLGGSEKVSVFKVSVYAKKDGYADSDVATKEIKVSLMDGDVNKDGKVNAADHVALSNIILEK